MRYCVPLGADDSVGMAWGRAPRVAIAEVKDGQITDWQVHDVGWDVAHDAGTHGAHHARIARFLLDNHVDAVVAQHVGPGMVRMLGTMKIPTLLGASGDARSAVIQAAGTVTQAAGMEGAAGAE